MPKQNIDYSKTIIYKIYCLDTNITDIYVGHTTNFRRRKYEHKSICNNENDKAYTFYVYQFIRQNGGWDNWRMESIEERICKDALEAKRIEGEYILKLKSTLNKLIAGRTEAEYYIDNKEIINEQNRQYYNENKEQILEHRKQHYQDNKEQILEYQKQFYQENKEQILEHQKQYYEENKETISEKRKKTKFVCECGSECRISDKPKHLKTNKHIKFLEENQ